MSLLLNFRIKYIKSGIKKYWKSKVNKFTK
jgi:hypothetical protein